MSSVVGFIKGESAIHVARVYGEQKENYVGQSLWARGYFVSAVGRDEATIRDYPQPGAGRQTAGSTEHVAMTCHRKGGPTQPGPR